MLFKFYHCKKNQQARYRVHQGDNI